MQRKSSTRTFCAFSLLFLFAQITLFRGRNHEQIKIPRNKVLKTCKACP